jgi:hypothetical protein
MQVDQFVSKQFDDLTNGLARVLATKHSTEMGDGISEEIFNEWAISVLSLLQRVFGEKSVQFIKFNESYNKFHGWAYEADPCIGIFKSAKSDFKSGYIYKLEMLVSAEVISDVIDQAKILQTSRYKDAACIVVGVALESSLKKLCKSKSIAEGKMDKMNADLAKAGIYNVGMQKQITAWADLRNNAAHGNWTVYKAEDVDAMINGIERFMATYL